MNISQIDLSKVPDEKIEAIIDGLVKNNFTEFNKFFSQFGTLYGQKPEDLLDNKYAQNVVLDKIEIHKLLKEKTFIVNERMHELLKKIFDKFFEIHHRTKHELIDKINVTKDEVVESLTNLINNISAELTQKLTDESEIRLNKDLELEEKIETVDYAVSDLKTKHNERISNLEVQTTENTTAIRDEILDRKNAIAELKAAFSGKIDDKIDQISNKTTELSDKIAEARENFNDKIAEIRENVTSKIEKNANDIANLNDKTRHNYESILELDNKINNTQQDVEEIRDNTIPGIQQDIYDVRDNNIPAINANLNDIGDRVTTLEQTQLSVVQDISNKIINNEALVGEIAAKAATQTATVVNGAIQQFTATTFNPIISRLDQKDNELNDKIDQEIADRTNADSQINQAIVDEATAREQKDQELSQRIVDETTARISADDQINQAIADETSSRASADEQIIQRIDNETSARETKDEELERNLNQEILNRSAAYNQLDAKISAEATTREQNDQELRQAIDVEATARETADNQVNDAIDNLNTTAIKKIIISDLADIENVDSVKEIELDSTNNKLEYLNGSTLWLKKYDQSIPISDRLTIEQTFDKLNSNINESVGALNEQLNNEIDRLTTEVIPVTIAQNGLIYTIKQGGREIGTIEIPKDQFLHSADLDGNKLILTFETNSGLTPIEVDLSKFIDIYTGSDSSDTYGINTSIDNNKISVTLNNEFTEFLNNLNSKVSNIETELTAETTERETADEILDGKINDITDNLNTKFSTLVESLNNEASTRATADTNLNNKINTNTTDIAEIKNNINTLIEETIPETYLSKESFYNEIQPQINANTENIADIVRRLGQHDIKIHNLEQKDIALEQAIADESTDRISAINNLTSVVTDEIHNRNDAENKINQNIETIVKAFDDLTEFDLENPGDIDFSKIIGKINTIISTFKSIKNSLNA